MQVDVCEKCVRALELRGHHGQELLCGCLLRMHALTKGGPDHEYNPLHNLVVIQGREGLTGVCSGYDKA